MASENSIVLVVPEPDGDPVWVQAPERVKAQFYAHVADYAQALKLRELRAGKSVAGKPLAPVKPTSRPDGATGPPLSPHQPESRSQKWLRVSVGRKARTVTLHWSHGWGTILGYHARELRPRRDVIGLTPDDLKKFEAECRRFWGLLRRRPMPFGPTREWRPPESRPPITPGLPVPFAAKGPKVVYLPPGGQPKVLSRRIQVYER